MSGDDVLSAPAPWDPQVADAVADAARLAALGELGLLDAEPEPEFERVTTLASELLGAPISLISLVGRDRQFFTSAHGLTGAWAQARQTPLSHSICQVPVATGTPLVVEDTSADPRFADHLAVRDLAIRAYLGVPLTLSDGHSVGALCAIDHVPRAFSARERGILGDLAAIVQSLLELRRTIGRQRLHEARSGLPNRSLLAAFADEHARAHRPGEQLAVAVGLDDVAVLTEGYGLAETERLIGLIARRLAASLAPDDVLGRVADDVLVVLRPRVADQIEAVDLALALRDAVQADPATPGAEPIALGAQTGLATAAPGIAGEALLNRALASLAHARTRREAGTSERRSTDQTAARARLRGALAGAARRGEIHVHFQPIVELATGATRGYEALARWRHPEHGLVGPAEFIPVAESTGDIVAIGEHVLRTACDQLALWRSMLPGEDLGVTVNVSPIQLAVPTIPELVASVLDDSGVPGAALTLEITEGVFVSPDALKRRNLDAIRALGVQIALDDFGTGYSALSYLKRMPVDIIKIDRCFLDGLETEGRDAALMRAILSIGSGMELGVVAEGIETRAQRELLRLSGCHWGQGFLFAEPLPADEVRLPALVAAA